MDDPRAMIAAASTAATAAMDDFRGKPNRLGRARMFAEKSVGMDDPGMRAFQRILGGLT